MNKINNEVMAELQKEAPSMTKEDIFLRMLLITFHGILKGEAELYYLDDTYLSRFIGDDDNADDVPEGAQKAEPKDYYNDLIHPRLMAGIRRGNWMVVDTSTGPTVIHKALMCDRDYFNALTAYKAIEFVKSTVADL